MRQPYKIASTVLVLATAVACGGAGEDDGLFGASGGSAGSGGGSAGKSSGGTSNGGTAGKAAGGTGGTATGGTGGKAAGGSTTAGTGGAPVGGNGGSSTGGAGMSGNAGQPSGGKGGAAGGAGGKGGAGGVAGKGGAGGSKAGAGGNTSGGSGGNTSGGSGGNTSGGSGGNTTGGSAGDPTGGGGNTTGGSAGDPTGGGGNTTGGAAGDPTGGGGNTTGGAAGDPTGGGGAGTGGAAGDPTGGGGAGTGGSATGGAGTGGSATGGAGAGGAGAGGAGAGGAGAGGTGGAPGCVGDHTACATTSGGNGLCVNGSCADCVAPADDAACRTAYPTSDLCVAGSCEACDAPSGGILFVDPVNGSDARGLGSVTANGVAAPTCALKTITAAIKLINTGTVATTISVVGPATLDASESYPLVIPANVVVTTKGDVIAAPVPANAPGNNATIVRLVADGAAIDTDDTFMIDGTGLPNATGASANSGITADNGSTNTTHLRGVTITNMPGNGIRLQAQARLTIQEGVTVTGSGRGANYSGIFMTDGGSFLTIDVPSGRPTIIEKSGASGITLSGASGLKILGVPTAGKPDTGTVVSRLNGVNGMSLQANGAGQLGVSVDGMVTYDNGAPGGQFGDGMYILMNTKAKVRRSVSLANARSGIHVDGGNGSIAVVGIAVDLGTSGDEGGNWVQNLAADGDQNTGVGICFTPPQTFAAGTLPARGNLFGKGKDCSTTAAALTKDGQCGGQKDTTVASFNIAVSMDVAMCTIP